MKRNLLIIACITDFILFSITALFSWKYNSDSAGIFEVVLIAIILGFIINSLVSLKKKKSIDKILIELLIAANILGLCSLAVLYFYAFDLQWGINREVLTWGLPLFTGIIVMAVGTYYLIKRQTLRSGLWGSAAGYAAFVYAGILLFFFSTIFFGVPQNSPKDTPDTVENRILDLLLTSKTENTERITFIDSTTSQMGATVLSSETSDDLINQTMKVLGQNETMAKSIQNLLYKHIQINLKPVPFTINKSIKDGFYIDYDGKISRYFKDGAGWDRLRFLRRCIGEYMTVTYPAYDPETGIVIVAMGFQKQYLFGSGGLYIFRYEDNQLWFLAYHSMWTS